MPCALEILKQTPGRRVGAVSDDKTNNAGQDRKRISLAEDYEVRDWAAKFGVSEDDLRASVERVGNMAEDVERDSKSR